MGSTSMRWLKKIPDIHCSGLYSGSDWTKEEMGGSHATVCCTAAVTLRSPQTLHMGATTTSRAPQEIFTYGSTSWSWEWPTTSTKPHGDQASGFWQLREHMLSHLNTMDPGDDPLFMAMLPDILDDMKLSDRAGGLVLSRRCGRI